MRVCLRSYCPNGENKCCLECCYKNSCEKLGKCSLDDYNLNLKDCSKEIERVFENIKELIEDLGKGAKNK